MQKTNNIVLFLVIAVLVVTSFIFLRKDQTPQIIEMPEQEIVQEIPPMIDENTAVETVTLFVQKFVESAQLEGSQEAMEDAISYLSEEALASLTKTEDLYTTEDLIQFMGVQEIPTMGYSTSLVSSTEDIAEIKVTFEHLEGPVERLFKLSNVDGVWKIDSVEDFVAIEIIEPEAVEEIEE